MGQVYLSILWSSVQWENEVGNNVFADKGPLVEIAKSEYEELLDRASSAEKKVSHLSGLLGEAETESQRMSQLASVLKEEIRTYQRSEERSKHIENLEYVKNVIIKVYT